MVSIQLVTGSGLLLLLVSINLSYVEPSCTLLDFRGRPIKRAGYVHSALNYLRYDSSFYTPYSFFNSTLGLDCVNSNITYKNRRLSIILYCPIAPGPTDQQYIDVFPTDPKLIRLAHRWNDCHSTTYRLHYDDASRSLYVKATMNTGDGNRTSMFLAQKQWAEAEIEKMDKTMYLVVRIQQANGTELGDVVVEMGHWDVFTVKLLNTSTSPAAFDDRKDRPRRPPCALLSWKGTDVQKPFNASGKLTYLRYDSATYYRPFSVFNFTYLGAFCIHVRVSYSKSRLNIDLLCTNDLR
uniref:Uncharacterized protein n=1 Tax=Anopheles merus TaxID=30066 RepID=A0A182VHU7_ANOME